MNTASIPTNKTALSRFGLAPGLVVLILLVDTLLFGGEASTGGFFVVISIFVSMLLGGIAFLWQWLSGRDRFLPALCKGTAIGVLTAIPSPLATMLPLLLGLLTFVPASTENKNETTDNQEEKIPTPGMRTARGRVVSTGE